jgi:hypothetical protein
VSLLCASYFATSFVFPLSSYFIGVKHFHGPFIWKSVTLETTFIITELPEALKKKFQIVYLQCSSTKQADSMLLNQNCGKYIIHNGSKHLSRCLPGILWDSGHSALLNFLWMNLTVNKALLLYRFHQATIDDRTTQQHLVSSDNIRSKQSYFKPLQTWIRDTATRITAILQKVPLSLEVS